MTIYELSFDAENYRILVPCNESEMDGGNLWINGTLKHGSWRAPEMRYAEKASELENIADITQITPGFFAFNGKALNHLSNMLKEYGELLNLNVLGEELTAFNPHHEIDCFDPQRSEWKTRRDGSKGRLEKPALKMADIGDAAIFQVPEYLQSKLFVQQRFKDLYDQAGLTGLRFSAL